VRLRLLIPSLVGLLLAANAARADTITVNFDNVDPGRAVSVRLGSTNIDTRAGLFNFDRVSGSTAFGNRFQSFCIELDAPIGSNPITFDINALSGPKAARISEFWGENFGKIGTNADLAAAFQLGLWEIIYDNTADLGGGNFRVNSAPVAALSAAQSWLGQVNGSGTFASGLVTLSSPTAQDQITVVPVPPTVLLAVVGMAGLAGYGWRRRLA